MIKQNTSQKNPYDAGLFRGFIFGAIVGVYVWEWNKSLNGDTSA